MPASINERLYVPTTDQIPSSRPIPFPHPSSPLQVRHACLSVVSKVLYVSSPGMLEGGLRDLPICSFISGLLSGRDSSAVAYAMQMAEVLMDRLPGMYRVHFLKEGVLHAINQLAGTAPATSKASDPKSTESPDSEGQKASKGVSLSEPVEFKRQLCMLAFTVTKT